MDGVEGVPAGVTGTPIHGVPPGVTGTPIQGGAAGIQGVPPGVIGTPIGGSAPPQAPTPWWAQDPRRNLEEAKGFVKEAGRTVTGLLDTYSKTPGGIVPGIAPGTAAGAEQIARKIEPHTQLNGPYQHEGGLAEMVTELMSVPEAAVEGGAAKAATFAEHLSEGAKFAKFLEANPKIARFVRAGIDAAKGATRGAVEQGVQTDIKSGGDADATASAATTGAAFGGVIGGGAGALRETADAMQKAKPVERKIAGANFQTRAKTGKLNLAPLEEVTVDPATQAVDAATGNIGKTAVANSLNRANAARPRATEPLSPSRQLPAPEGRPAGMSVTTGETEPTGEGQIAFNPRKKQTGTEVREGKGPGEFDLPRYEGAERQPTGEGELTQRGSHKEPKLQYLTSPRPQEAGNVVTDTPMGGGGTMILTNDGQALSSTKARSMKAQIERILDDPAQLEEMGVRQHQQLIDQHADLTDQLRRYDDYAASQPHFPEHDVTDAVANTDSLGAAADQLKAAHSPFWKTADEASGGEWTRLREQEKFIEKKIYGPNPTGNLEDLQKQLADNQQAQVNFFDQHRTDVSPEEWKIARDGYQDGIVLGNLHNIIQKEFNGITRAEEGRALAQGGKRQRVFEPSSNFNSKLEDFYNTRTNRDVLERTIGTPHMDALKDIGQLFENSERREATKGLISQIGAAIRRHRWAVAGIGASTAAYGFEHGIGAAVGAAGAGALATGTVTGTLQYITEKLATDPAFANSFIYAVKNGVSPRFAAPLLATRIMSSMANQPETKKKEEPTQ